MDNTGSASATRTVIYTTKVGSFMTFISCDTGHLYMDYAIPESTDEANYIPKLTPSNKRIMELRIYNSSGVKFTVIEAKWTYNGINVDTAPECYTSKIIDGHAYLEVHGPIAALSNNRPIELMVEARVNIDNTTDVYTVWAEQSVPVRLNHGTLYHTDIVPVDYDYNYTIINNRSIKVKCLVTDPLGNNVTHGIKYQWWKYIDSQWEKVGSDTPSEDLQILTIGAHEFKNQCNYKVRAYTTGTNGALECIGEDTQNIYDSQDPFRLFVSPTPEDEILDDIDPNRQRVDYRADLRSIIHGIHAQSADIEIYATDSVGIVVSGPVTRHWEYDSTVHYNQNSIIFSVFPSDFVNGGPTLAVNFIARKIY